MATPVFLNLSFALTIATSSFAANTSTTPSLAIKGEEKNFYLSQMKSMSKSLYAFCDRHDRTSTETKVALLLCAHHLLESILETTKSRAGRPTYDAIRFFCQFHNAALHGCEVSIENADICIAISTVLTTIKYLLGKPIQIGKPKFAHYKIDAAPFCRDAAKEACQTELEKFDAVISDLYQTQLKSSNMEQARSMFDSNESVSSDSFGLMTNYLQRFNWLILTAKIKVELYLCCVLLT